MSKKSSMIPMPTGGSSVVPKLITGLVGLALFAIVVRHPSEAAGWMTDIFGWLGGVVDGLASFIRQVA
ncbi:hypothetical protein B1813_06745 [Saccharomonospora piscinae]|uniref:Uncharacterized protein n=1 Tax=Saccharomonospora piscinae TaxID=687388 RepID=A0A1V9A4L9_SACPI|nr:hypothetical protein [Saccharomonospora piscinae]OQO91976.1 hypothetical protein B1813_06745 [Saccharomonospora piscinae]